MIVRLLKPWKFRKVGHILNDMPDGAANVLIKRGFAEPIQPPKENKPKKQPAGK